MKLGAEVPGCTGPDCVRIKDSTGHAFDYIHVYWKSASLYDGEPINPGQAIGYIDLENHLHLDDVNLGTGFKQNPETNGLDFADGDSPQWDSILVGNVDASLIPVDAGSGQPLILDPQIVSPPTFIWPASQPPVGVYVTGRDGAKRKGLYSVSIAVSNFASPPFTSYSNILQFDDLNDLNSSAGVDVVYLQRNVNSDTWQGTSLWGSLATTSLGLGQAQASPIDLTNAANYPNGDYQLCATLTALKSPGNPASLDSNCVDILIDTAPPKVTINTSEGLGSETFSGPVEPTVVVPVTFAPSMTIEDSAVGLSSFSLINSAGNVVAQAQNLGGVLEENLVTPPNPQSYLPSSLPEDQYLLSAANMAGLSTQAPFLVDASPVCILSLPPLGQSFTGNGISGTCTSSWGVASTALCNINVAGCPNLSSVPLPLYGNGTAARGELSVPFTLTIPGEGCYFVGARDINDVQSYPTNGVCLHNGQISGSNTPGPFFLPTGSLTVTPLGGSPIDVNLSFQFEPSGPVDATIAGNARVDPSPLLGEGKDEGIDFYIAV